MVDQFGNDVVDSKGNKIWFPADFDPAAAAAFGKSLASKPPTERYQNFGRSVEGGGPWDLQRSYNGQRNARFAEVFTPAASYVFGLIGAAAEIPQIFLMAGGGAYNVMKNPRTAGLYFGNNPKNVPFIEQGFRDYFESPLAPTVPKDSFQGNPAFAPPTDRFGSTFDQAASTSPESAPAAPGGWLNSMVRNGEVERIIRDNYGGFDNRFRNWGSSPAGIAPQPAPGQADSFEDRFGNWGSVPARDSDEPRSRLLRELQKYGRSAAPDGAASPSVQAASPSPATSRPVDVNTLAQGVTRLLSGVGGFTGNSLIPPVNAASPSRPPLTPTLPGFPAAAPTADPSNPAYFPGWSGRPMADPIGSPLSRGSIFDTGAPAVPLGGVLKYSDERMMPSAAQEPAGLSPDLAAGTEPVPDTPTNVTPGFRRLTRMVSSAFAGSNPPNPTPAPPAGRPLGLVTGEPMPDWPVPPPIFDFGDRRGQQDRKASSIPFLDEYIRYLNRTNGA